MNIVKKITSTVMAVLIATTSLAAGITTAFANENGNCGKNVTYTYDSKTKALTVQGNGRMDDFATPDSVPWNSIKSEIQSIKVNNGVTSIGENAFYNLTSVSNVTFSNTVEEIGDSAFFGCKNINNLTLPTSLKNIGKYAFYDNEKITNVIVPKNVTVINESTFGDCTSLQTVSFDGKVTSIGKSAFNNCALTSVDGLSNSLEKIFDYAFAYNDFTNFTIPNSVISIGNNAFYKCRELTTITTPDSVTNIGASAFEGCSSLAIVKIGNNVESIGDGGFKDCVNMTTLSIPASLNCYETATPVFDNCTNIKTITITKGNGNMIDFDGTFNIPNSKVDYYVSNYTPWTISNASNMKVIIDKGVENIGKNTFVGATNLQSVEIAFGVKNIADNAFSKCVNLKTVKYNGCATAWNKIAVSDVGNENLKLATITTLNHEYNAVVTNPTCTEEGYTTHTCVYCGNEYADKYVSPLGHNYTGKVRNNGDETHSFLCENGCGTYGYNGIENGKQDCYAGKKATCTEKAVCGVCGEEFGEPLGHNYNKTVTEPTCLKGGYTTYVCSYCGDTYVADETQPLGHSFKNYVSNNDATCTEDGTKTAKCNHDGCNETDTVKDEGSALGHNYKATVTKPTCLEAGYTTYTCLRCGNTYISDHTAPLGHSFTEYISNNDATCTADGTKTAICDHNDCDVTDTITDKGSALGHDYKATVTAPTCTEKGYTTYVCRRCGDTYVANEVAPLGHSFKNYFSNNDATCTKDGTKTAVCDRDGCNVKDTITDKGSALGHGPVRGETVNVVDPTCENTGSYQIETYCARCGAKIATDTYITKPLGHDYKTTVTKPTCTKDGYTTYVCARCGKTYVDDKVKAKGHSYTSWHVSKASTPNSNGKLVRSCKVCKVKETKLVNKLFVIQTAKGNSMTITWNKIPNASKYEVYFAKCGVKSNGDNTKYEKVAAVKNVTKYTISNLDKNACYKAYVVAYMNVDGKDVQVAKSYKTHATTKSSRYTNSNAVKVTSKKKLTLKISKTSTIKSKIVKANKYLPLVDHANYKRYLSTDTLIATVNSKGKITAKKSGKCKIIVYTIDGNRATVDVTVK